MGGCGGEWSDSGEGSVGSCGENYVGSCDEVSNCSSDVLGMVK